MRKQKFFIIRPTKADNLHKQSLDPISISLKNSCITYPNKPHTQIPQEEVVLLFFCFPRHVPRLRTRSKSRVSFFSRNSKLQSCSPVCWISGTSLIASIGVRTSEICPKRHSRAKQSKIFLLLVFFRKCSELFSQYFGKVLIHFSSF